MAENNNAPSASPDTVGVILEMREQAREARQSDPDAGIFADHAYADLLDEWANRLERHDGRMSGLVRDYIEGMSVSIDVSTGEHDAGNRYYGFVSEVMDDPDDKHGVTLLVQDDVRPNFKVSASPAALTLTGDEVRAIVTSQRGSSNAPQGSDYVAATLAYLNRRTPAPAALSDGLDPLRFIRHALKLADRLPDSEIAYTLRLHLNSPLLAASPADQVDSKENEK